MRQNAKKVTSWIRTKTFQLYLWKFAVRILIFLGILGFYLKDKELLIRLTTQPFWKGFSSIHLLWLMFMATMLRHLFPKETVTMAMKKAKIPIPESWAKEKVGAEKAIYKEMELWQFVQDMNVKAWMVLLVWLCFNAIFGFLYLLRIIGDAELLMLTVFYFLSDYICILVFCPFQTFIMKNRCCVNCRIYDWGHFMMFTPMLFIRNFYSWSLFFTSVVVLIRWEIIYAKYPERFWFGSNVNLECINCKDKQCQLKKRIVKAIKNT